MVRHIVMWKLKDKAAAPAVKQALEGLRGRIPGLLGLEVGIDFLASAQSADVVLIAELEDCAALAAYQQHAAHQAVLPMIQAATVSRTVVDYEV